MPDPFELLRAPTEPIEPDPIFSSRLRERLARALVLPKGVVVSDLVLGRHAGIAVHDHAAPPIAGRAALTPYLAVSGAREAIGWYAEALGARLTDEPIVMPDGRVGHAELDIAGARLMLSEEHPEIGVVAPPPGGGSSVTMHLSVDDVDEVVERCLAAGATLERPAAEYEYGRNGVIRDPFGHRWLIASEAGPAQAEAAAIRHGDIGYVSLWVPDADRAATFFASVLGWEYEPESRPDARQVAGHRLHHGIFGGVSEPTLFCCYAVDDVDAAAERVRVAGGAASEPHDEPYGRIADASDPEGTRFAVFTPPGGTAADTVTGPGPTGAAGARQGDLAYVTMEVTDSARTRGFYGAVLGWRASPGRVADGWNIEGVVPMVGIAGGRPAARCVPLYAVDDIADAVGRVRAAGGTATDPEVQPYGITAEATDDQGTHFYLGQLG